MVAGDVRRSAVVEIHRGVQRTAERVDGENVHTAVAYERRRARHRVEHPLNLGPNRGLLSAAWRAARGPGRTGEVEQVGVLGLVELQRAGDRVQDVLGHAADVALLEPRVPVRADASEHSDLFASQARDAAAAAACGQTDLLGSE